MDIIVYSHCPGCGTDLIYPALEAKDYTVTGEQFEIWQCKQCSLRFTQNAPGKLSIGKYYQSANYISHTDTKRGFVNTMYHIIRKRTLNQKLKLVQHVTGKREGNLLDIGAGTGAFSAHMRNAGWQVIGLEPDYDTRNRAMELYEIQLQDSNHLFELTAGSIDAVTMWHVLEHVHDLHQYIDQVKTILGKSGKLFIAVPNYTSLDAQSYGRYWAAYDVPRHLYHFSPLSMKMLLQRHNMIIHDIRPMWYDSFYVSLLSEQYKNGSPGHLPAILNGLRSNVNTVTDKYKCSSLIYIVNK
ncbi:MAG: class I SAM-dependent methyltransferase [Chitinophagaceae bacterium]